MKFEKIGFIGLGLIGGSIARKIRQNRPRTEIIATAGHETTVREAWRRRIIDNAAPLPLSAFSDCDLIFLCAPVQKNLENLQELKNIIKKDCYITDVGSTKTDIHTEVIRLGLENNFIGGHPMTGSEKTGIENSDPAILVNAYYIITPTAKTPQSDLEEFRDFVRDLGSIPMILDYEAHDHATASISHLPHMIAFSLVNLVRKLDDSDETMKTIAAGGFKDITRIASSSPVMWQNICVSNREQLLSLMDTYMEQLQTLRGYIDASDEQKLADYFQTARDYRDSIGIPGAGRRSTIHEIYLDLDDKAGEIASVATILGRNNISIRNLEIINCREFVEGVLRVEFYDGEAQRKAEELLNIKEYKLHQR